MTHLKIKNKDHSKYTLRSSISYIPDRNREYPQSKGFFLS